MDGLTLPEDAALFRLWDALPRARLVGGAVRDLLARRALADLDLATPDRPEEVQRILQAASIKTVPTGIAHGTVTAVVDHRPFEITTLRRDVATDGRWAETEWTDDWSRDAARRDFTINAMSLERDGTLHDYFGGAQDLAAGRVRFVGDAATRIREDHLRILRFFRFWARYGRGEPDREATDAIASLAHLLGTLSAERVWSELKRLLAAPDPAGALRLMQSLGALDIVLPEAAGIELLDALRAIGAPPDPVLRLAALIGDGEAGLAQRLRLSAAEARLLAGLRGGPAPVPSDDEDTLRRLLVETEPAILVGRAWLAQARNVTGEAAAWAGADWTALRALLAAIPRPVFPLAGRDAVARGVVPGPAVGRILGDVRVWWLRGGAHAGRAACLAALDRAIAASADRVTRDPA